MTERRRGRRKTPDQDAMDHIIRGEDKSFLEGRFINTYKGKFFIQYINVCFSKCSHLTVAVVKDAVSDVFLLLKVLNRSSC